MKKADKKEIKKPVRGRPKKSKFLEKVIKEENEHDLEVKKSFESDLIITKSNVPTIVNSDETIAG